MDSVSDGQFPSVEESLHNRVPFQTWKCHTTENYEKILQVGEGTFGKVYKAKYRNSNGEEKIVALKQIITFEDQGFPITALREILIMKRLNHKNILKLEEVLTSPPSEKNKKRGTVYLVFQYMDNDFSGIRMSNINYNLSQIKNIFYQILCGMQYLHKCKIIHRDIKSSNILMNNKGEIKIADYGLARRDSKQNHKKYTCKVVTICYRAPELLLGFQEYGTEVDMWSIGCVFCELLSGVIIFKESQDEKAQLNKIFSICGTPDEKEWPGVTDLPRWKEFAPKTNYCNSLREFFKNNNKVDDVTFDLINKLLQLNPKNRISADDALKHPFFTNEPLMAKQSELIKSIPDELHEYQTEKDRKEKKSKLGDLKDKNNNNNNMNIGNKDFIGKKRNENTKSQDITPVSSYKKSKQNTNDKI